MRPHDIPREERRVEREERHEVAHEDVQPQHGGRGAPRDVALLVAAEHGGDRVAEGPPRKVVPLKPDEPEKKTEFEALDKSLLKTVGNETETITLE